jgi:mannose-6-phosphate isomerase-like protein (cupin superfamily)
MQYVISPRDIEWRTLEKPGFPANGFQFTDNMIDEDYTSAYSVQMSKIGPGGRSKLHRETVNHAFYIISGTGTVRIEKKTWDMEPGTVVKVPKGLPHSIDNTGSDDLVFLVIYDPPTVTGKQDVPNLEG